MADLKNSPIGVFLRKNKICPICTAKKLAASTQIHLNGADKFSNGTALTPPMGWASWNLFRNRINETLIEDIEKAMRENINFMWLSGQQVADHNTIARFRTKRLKDSFKDIFKQVVLLLVAEGLVNIKIPCNMNAEIFTLPINESFCSFTRMSIYIFLTVH